VKPQRQSVDAVADFLIRQPCVFVSLTKN
jgi:hypothetical protein